MDRLPAAEKAQALAAVERTLTHLPSASTRVVFPGATDVAALPKPSTTRVPQPHTPLPPTREVLMNSRYTKEELKSMVPIPPNSSRWTIQQWKNYVADERGLI